jgi:putative phosphoribosyl transferase
MAVGTPVPRSDEKDRVRNRGLGAAELEAQVALFPAEMARSADQRPPCEREVGIEVLPDDAIEGQLLAPWGVDSHGVVVFAAGRDYRSRLDPYSHRLAQVLNDAGIATLLLDLLSAEEAGRSGHLLDVELMERRLVASTNWLRRQPDTARLAVGYFGEGTGAAAALFAAAELGTGVAAVVCHDGRLEALGRHLRAVTAPVLLTLIEHPGADLLASNVGARRQLRCQSELALVAQPRGASDEIDTLDRLTGRTAGWFIKHLAEGSPEATRLHAHEDGSARAARTA